MQFLSADSHKRMRWKNGRGETVEIAIGPPQADVNAFDWRVSAAAVVEDGTFSVFPDIDRTLAVVSGGPLLLEVAGVPAQTLAAGDISACFAADAQCRARLLGAPVTDLNVMTRRASHRHTLERLASGGRVGTVYGEIRVVVAAPAAARLRIGGANGALGAWDALSLDVDDGLLEVLEGELWLVRIRPA